MVAEKIPVSFVQIAHDTGSMRKSEQEIHNGTFLSLWTQESVTSKLMGWRKLQPGKIACQSKEGTGHRSVMMIVEPLKGHLKH